MSLATNVSDLATRIATEVKALRTLINGNASDLSALDTTAKTNLVAAINEVNTIAEAAAGGGVAIDDDTPSGTTTYSSTKIEALVGAIDLTDLINDTTASTSTVYSSTKTDSQISAAVAALVDSAPGTLDTLNELAAALGDDPNYATTITSALAAKAPLASPALTGTPTAPTATGGTNTTQIATTAFVQAAIPAATPDASETVKGKVELATNAEVVTGTDTSRATTPAGVKAQLDDKVGDTTTNFVTTFEAGLV